MSAQMSAEPALRLGDAGCEPGCRLLCVVCHASTPFMPCASGAVHPACAGEKPARSRLPPAPVRGGMLPGCLPAGLRALAVLRTPRLSAFIALRLNCAVASPPARRPSLTSGGRPVGREGGVCGLRDGSGIRRGGSCRHGGWKRRQEECGEKDGGLDETHRGLRGLRARGRTEAWNRLGGLNIGCRGSLRQGARFVPGACAERWKPSPSSFCATCRHARSKDVAVAEASSGTHARAARARCRFRLHASCRKRGGPLERTARRHGKEAGKKAENRERTTAGEAREAVRWDGEALKGVPKRVEACRSVADAGTVQGGGTAKCRRAGIRAGRLEGAGVLPCQAGRLRFAGGAWRQARRRRSPGAPKIRDSVLAVETLRPKVQGMAPCRAPGASSAREAPFRLRPSAAAGGRAACGGGGEEEGRAPCAGALRQACRAKLEVLPARNASVRMRSELGACGAALAHAARACRHRRPGLPAQKRAGRRPGARRSGPSRCLRVPAERGGAVARPACPPSSWSRSWPFAAPPSARRPWPRPERRTWHRRRSGKGVPSFSRRRRAAGRRRPASRWPRDGPAMAMALPEMLDGQAGRADRLAAGPLRSRALSRRGLHSAGPGGVPGCRRAG